MALVDNMEPQVLVLLPIRTCGPPTDQLSRMHSNSVVLPMPQIVLCIASGGKAISFIFLFIELTIRRYSSHGLYRPRPFSKPQPIRHDLPPARPQLAGRDVGPLSGDAIRRDAADRLPDMEVRSMELLQEPPRIASRHPLDPRRVRRALQRHDYLPARIFVDEHRRDIRRVARSDQRACFLLLRLFFSPSSDVFLFVCLQALAPMLIIARVGLKSCGSQSSFTSAKGSMINNPFYPGQQPIRDVESVSREDDVMVVHIRQATEIRLDDMKLVSAA